MITGVLSAAFGIPWINGHPTVRGIHLGPRDSREPRKRILLVSRFKWSRKRQGRAGFAGPSIRIPATCDEQPSAGALLVKAGSRRYLPAGCVSRTLLSETGSSWPLLAARNPLEFSPLSFLFLSHPLPGRELLWTLHENVVKRGNMSKFYAPL